MYPVDRVCQGEGGVRVGGGSEKEVAGCEILGFCSGVGGGDYVRAEDMLSLVRAKVSQRSIDRGR